MARYIDADALMNQLSKKIPEPGKMRYMDGFNDAISRVRSMVSTAPSVDVVPRSELDIAVKEVDRLSQVVLYNDAFTQDRIMDIFDELDEIVKEHSEGFVDDRYFYDRIKKFREKWLPKEATDDE